MDAATHGLMRMCVDLLALGLEGTIIGPAASADSIGINSHTCSFHKFTVGLLIIYHS